MMDWDAWDNIPNLDQDNWDTYFELSKSMPKTFVIPVRLYTWIQIVKDENCLQELIERRIGVYEVGDDTDLRLFVILQTENDMLWFKMRWL